MCGSTCTDPRVDVHNCGSCGHACDPGNVCVAGACALSCPSNLTTCGSSCVDTMTDPANCQSCGHACATGELCAAGQCKASGGCPSNLTTCGSTCVDTAIDSHNCGTCGMVCPSFQLCSNSACRYPTSCADLKANFGSSVDGSYMIQPTGKKPFIVYCKDLATAPKEYLTLVFTNGSGYSASNYSGYYCNNCLAEARNYFEKVRIDPATLLVDVSDTTFSAWSATVPSDTSCWATIGGACGTVRNEWYAHAGNCILNGAPNSGNVDLRGTTFSIDPSVTTVVEGDSPYGSATFSADRTVLSLTGGGDCGDIAPAIGSTNNLFLLKQD
jgi:hypothetical protein